MGICPRCNIEVMGTICPRCGGSLVQATTQPYPQQLYQQPYQQPVPRPLPPKGKAALVLAIISVIMLFITGAIGWWSMSYEYERIHEFMEEEDVTQSKVKVDFTLEEMIAEVETISDGETDTIDGDVDLSSDMEDVADITGLLLLLGAVMSILVIILIGLILGIIQTRSRMMAMFTKLFKNLALLFALLAVIFVLIAPIYYMFTWPEATEDQMGTLFFGSDEKIYDGTFMGSDSFEHEEDWGATYKGDISWGPSFGWYLSFICVFLLVITFFLVKLAGDEAMILAPAPLPRYWPQYTPQPPQPNLPPPPPNPPPPP
ncbi:MAG: hypothetical protein JSW00_00475 [Thermoplasmata archaeon]|nr:MAG: hypothetical protein JSW00_00475 [Thermoplasmata archaeon]